VEDLCRKHAPGKRQKEALGYHDSGGLFASSVSSVPNNLPWILRRTGADWNPFFERRIFPPDLLEQVGGYHPPADLPNVVQAAGKIRLAAALRSDRYDDRARPVLAILGLLYARRGRSTTELAHATGLDFPKVAQVLAFLRTGGLVDDHHRVTERGIAELRASRRLRRGVPATLPDGTLSPYYPLALR